MDLRRFWRDNLTVLGETRRKLPRVMLIVVLAALLDLASLGLAAPFIVLLFNPGALDVPVAGPLREIGAALALTDRTATAWLGVAVGVAFALKAFMAFHLQRAVAAFSELHRSRLMGRLMEARLNQPYEQLLNRNSSETISDILTTTQQYASGILIPLLRLTAEVLALVVVVAYLARVSLGTLLLSGAVLLCVLSLYGLAVRKRLGVAGTEYTKASADLIKAVNQALGGVAEIRILGKEQVVLEDVQREASRLSGAMITFLALQSIPRPLIEFSVVALLVCMGLFSPQAGGAADIGPLLGIFAVASLRLLPGITSIISVLGMVRNSSHTVGRLAQELVRIDAAPMAGAAPAKARDSRKTRFESVDFDGVSYAYPGEGTPAVRGVSFRIRAGQAIGVVGRTGSGKTTVAALLLGLLRPCEGRILVNGHEQELDSTEWRRHLAFVPQSVFLLDDSVRRNIALGERDHEIDDARIRSVVEAAQLQELLGLGGRGLDARVGERGALLSGGQRQRIALARALYFDRDIIVMDEATASLDHETERAVVSAIRSLHGSKTLFIIAHRTSTLEGCDLVLRMDAGRIVETGSYDRLVRAAQG
jgi:ABC-type multidrug transport system fused ATPase/permease subunit